MQEIATADVQQVGRTDDANDRTSPDANTDSIVGSDLLVPRPRVTVFEPPNAVGSAARVFSRVGCSLKFGTLVHEACLQTT